MGILSSRRAGYIPILLFLFETPISFAETETGIQLTQAEEAWIEENHTVRIRVRKCPLVDIKLLASEYRDKSLYEAAFEELLFIEEKRVLHTWNHI